MNKNIHVIPTLAPASRRRSRAVKISKYALTCGGLRAAPRSLKVTAVFPKEVQMETQVLMDLPSGKLT